MTCFLFPVQRKPSVETDLHLVFGVTDEINLKQRNQLVFCLSTFTEKIQNGGKKIIKKKSKVCTCTWVTFSRNCSLNSLS